MKPRSLDGQGSGGVDPAAARGRVMFLPGEISPYARKGDAAEVVEREVSRGRSSCELAAAKGRTWRKVKRALASKAVKPQMSRQLELPFLSRGEGL